MSSFHSFLFFKPTQRCRRYGLTAGLGLLALAGCRHAARQEVLRLDFENPGAPLAGWTMGNAAVPSAATAHAGQNAGLVSAAGEYGFSYVSTWEQLASPHRLRLHTWAWLPHSGIKGQLVLEIKRGNQPLYWQTMSFSEPITRYRQWEAVEQDFFLPDSLAPTDAVKLYVWRAAATPEDAYLDDLTLKKVN